MTEPSLNYVGFFLGSVQAEDGSVLFRVAAMETNSNYRKVAKLRVANKEPFNPVIGELIMFQTTSKDLQDDLSCEFSHLQEPLYSHDDVDGGLMHTHKNFLVGEEECTRSGVFRHMELGDMIDEKNWMVPGVYISMAFLVLPGEENFDLKVLQAVRKEGDMLVSFGKNRFDQIGRVLAAEKDHIIIQENESWNAFGHMKLVGFDERTLTDGIRPVFELANKQFVELFQQRLRGGPQIIMIKQVQNEQGEWQDEPSEEWELRGCALTVEESNDMVTVKMAAKFRQKVQFIMNLGEIYRFEVFLPTDDVQFWRQNKHGDHKVFQQTVGDGDDESDTDSTDPSDSETSEARSAEARSAKTGSKVASNMKLLDALEGHLMDGETLNALTDKKISTRSLNPAQQKAVQMARNKERKLVFIQGPPGTGKTFVLAHYISFLLHDKTPAVVMTPTRESLLNIKRITEEVMKNQNLHPDTFMDFWTYEKRIEGMGESEEARQSVKRWKQTMQEGNMSLEEYITLTKRLINKVKNDAVKKMFENVKVLFSTITSSFVGSMIKGKHFNPEVCIIDEAGQVMEAQTWPASCSFKRIILAGDPKQLPATVFSNEARDFELENSVMDRIMKQKERFSWIMLEDQYRCHPEIIAWSSKAFYHGDIKTAKEITNLKYHFDKVPRNNISRVYDPMVLIDTSMEVDTDLQIKCFEKAVMATTAVNKKKGDFTYSNEGEAEIALDHFKNLVEMGVNQKSIAIITPYKGQQELLRKMGEEQNLGTLHIGTVDSYQGQEFDVVIFSMVRSNPMLRLGFVEDMRRLNVAVTRARHHFCFIGNAYLLQQRGRSTEYPGPEIKSLLETFIESDHRFPPCFARQEFKSFQKNARITNNFGIDFQLFLKVSTDPSMHNFVSKYMENPRYSAKNRRPNHQNRGNWNRNNTFQQPSMTNESPASNENAQD